MTNSPHVLHKGTIVGMAYGRLTTTCRDGIKHNHTLATDTSITCDGKTCQATDLKAGTAVQVTTRHDDASVATSIDSGKHVRAVTKKSV
jgi:hypothetical protein